MLRCRGLGHHKFGAWPWWTFPSLGLVSMDKSSNTTLWPQPSQIPLLPTAMSLPQNLLASGSSVEVVQWGK